jgi:hypothetical protein
VKLRNLPPSGLLEWVKSQTFEWRDYIIYRSGWTYDILTGERRRAVDAVCSGCGTRMQFDRAPGRGSVPFGYYSPIADDIILSGDHCLCPACGEEVQALHVTSARGLARYVWVMSAEAQEGKLVLYLWRIGRDITKDGEIRWSAEPYEAAVFGARSAERYAHYVQNPYNGYVRSVEGWIPRKRFTDGFYAVCLVYAPEGLSKIYEGTECENCKLETYMSVEGEYLFPTVWMRTWQKHKGAEALMSLPGARRLTAAIIAENKRATASYRTEWNSHTDVLPGLNWKAKKPSGMLRLEKGESEYFIGTNDGIRRYEALCLARSFGFDIKPGEEDITWRAPTQKAMLRRGVLPSRCVRYFDSQRKKYAGDGIYSTLLTDYWDMAEKLGEDLHDKSVLFPQRLKAAHDAMVERQRVHAAEERRDGFRQRFERMSAYDFEYDGLLIRPCETEEELIREGKELHHCVARYAADHASGKTTIFFIRRAEAPDVPFYTLEFDEKERRVLQNRCIYNGERTDEVRTFEEKWIEWIKNGRKAKKERTNAA